MQIHMSKSKHRLHIFGRNFLSGISLLVNCLSGLNSELLSLETEIFHFILKLKLGLGIKSNKLFHSQKTMAQFKTLDEPPNI